MSSKSNADESSPQTLAKSHRPSGQLFRLLKRIVFALIPVMLLFGTTELGLRLWGFKFKPYVLDQDIFQSAGRGQLRTSAQFAGTIPYGFEFCVDQRFSRKKPPETIRIVMVGGSNVMRLGRAEHLKDQLESELRKPVEIINMGFSSGDSDRVLRATQEALRLEPDLLMIYSGHNEFYSLFSWDATFDCRILQWLQKQRLKRFHGHVFKNPEHENLSDKKANYISFRQNLEQIISQSKQHNIPVVIGSVSYNYLVKPGHVSDEKIEELASESLDQLRNKYQQNESDSSLAFALGYQLWQLKEYEQAGGLLDRAVSLAIFPNRADSEINDIIKGLVSKTDVAIADVEAAVRRHAVGGIPGPDLFDDHCHLNEIGNRLLMDIFAESIVNSLNRSSDHSK